MLYIVTSVDGIQIRLTDERWAHIVEEHTELAGMRLEVLGAVADPQRILFGSTEERLAVSETEPGKWIVVVYRQLNEDGFIITAFLTRRTAALFRRPQAWP